ncbi:MAG: DUF480 domain-containing protein [Planctomycetes bacterium]|nr:DUF480 domain-containing protein [Planctomycetota bacterium]MCL4730400.1 DUF480 domain-containing protein [Planctomycetota bacterium]
MLKLNAIERRVLGTLLEKWLTTPQNYPLSLNALTNGCNQKSARDPETSYTEQQVLETCQALKRRSLVTEFFGSSARVSKFEEALSVHLELGKEQAAVIAELLLRGPQSEGELRQRAGRMAPIADLATLHSLLEQLGTRPEPLVRRLSDPTRSRGVRWSHTLYADGEEPADLPESPAASQGYSPTTPALEERLAQLEARVAELERQLGVRPPAH